MADVIETLAKLKPAAPDRDAIFFAAGRASARHSPVWKWLCACLLVSHVILLIVWRATEPPTPRVEPDRPWNPPAESVPPLPGTPSIPFDRSASLLNLNPSMPEAVPTSSVVPEQHWTAHTNPSELRFD